MATIVRYEPFALSQPRFDRIVQRAFGGPGVVPGIGRRPRPVNLYQTAEAYQVQLPLPGVRPEDVEVSVQQDQLTVKASRQVGAPEGAQTLWQGFAAAEWQQSFTLPGEVDAERVEAHLEHGVLRLDLPKAAHSRPRQIKVQVVPGNVDGASPAEPAPAATPAGDA